MLAVEDTRADHAPVLSAPIRSLLEDGTVKAPRLSEVLAITRSVGVDARVSADAERVLGSDEAFASIKNNTQVSRNGSAGERLAFYALGRLLGADTFEVRRRLAKSLPRTDSPLERMAIPPEKGALIVQPQGWNVIEEAVTEARAAFDMPVAATAQVNPGKTFMTTAKIQGFALNSKIMALGRHPSVLRLVSRYLQGFPILTRINLLRSSNEFLQDNSSQFFHVDPEDFRQMKLFLMVSDVTEDTGPLHLLHANASEQVRVETGHRRSRLSDDTVFGIVGRDPMEVCVGPSGTVAFGDTCRCFHFGSRPGVRERLVVMYQYLTPFACYWPLGYEEVTSNYAEAVRLVSKKTGGRPTVLDRYLFGLAR